MSLRGRKPKPTAIKKLEGNPGRRKLNEREPKPANGMPSCPTWLETEAKKLWRRVCKELEMMGTLAKSDRETIAVFCQSYARWKESEEFLSTHGPIMQTQSGYIQQLPQVSISHSYMKRMIETGSLLGLNPSARSRLITSDKTNKTVDEMEALLD